MIPSKIGDRREVTPTPRVRYEFGERTGKNESSEDFEYRRESPREDVEPTKPFNTREVQATNECGPITKRTVSFRPTLVLVRL